MASKILILMAITALLGCFLLPGGTWVQSESQLVEQAESLLHVPVFMIILMLTVSIKPLASTRRILATAGMLLLAPVCVEILQPLVGRERTYEDVGLGMAGVGLGVCLLMAKRSSSGKRPRWIGAGFLILATALIPFLAVVWDYVQAQKSFPLLASFETKLELRRWDPQGCRIRQCDVSATQGRFSLEVIPDHDAVFPGVFLRDFPRDWNGMREVCLDVYMQGTNSASLWVRMDDREGRADYADRFQKMVVVQPGWNTICIGRSELEVASGGRVMDLGRIATWGVFLDRGSRDRVFCLDSVRLIVE